MTEGQGNTGDTGGDNDGFRFKVEVRVRFRDLDAMNHVNNAVYLTYFEIARLAFWEALTAAPGLHDLNQIVAEAGCTYRSPARLNEQLQIWIKPVEVRRSSFVLAYRIDERTGGRLIATGRTVQVLYDYAAERPVPIPPILRARFAAFADQPPPDEAASAR